MPLSWKIEDIFDGILNIVAFWGLWLKSGWGIALFLLIVVSQLILYVGFPYWFVLDQEDQQNLWSMIAFNRVTVLIFFSLTLSQKGTQN